MKIVGLTGGIGSGKTTVANMFKELGVPVYIADDEARLLTNKSKVIRKKIIALLGEEAYIKSKINKKFVANKVFNDEELLKKINKIIHPKVRKHFDKWVNKQKGVYCIKEAAILFENGSYKFCDHTILITAPVEDRIKRVRKRDRLSIKEIKKRIENQWSDEQKSLLADTIIENDTLETTQNKVNKTHLYLLKSFK